MVLVVKNLPANAANIRDVGFIPGLGRSSGGRHGNPLQYSCLANTKDRVIWWTMVHRVAEIQTQLKQCIFTHSTIICLVNSSCLGLCGQSTLVSSTQGSSRTQPASLPCPCTATRKGSQGSNLGQSQGLFSQITPMCCLIPHAVRIKLFIF